MWPNMLTILDSIDLGENVGREGPGQDLVPSLSRKPGLSPTFMRDFVSSAHCLHSSAC